ncbi:MAG: HipA domain-containing protein [Silvanigrellales bacterium]|nr:HipA domain-containing protein [Silvanigrellales bacterium]
MIRVLRLQVHIDGQWRSAARVIPSARGSKDPNADVIVRYEFDYALDYEGRNDRPQAAVSLATPVSSADIACEKWPGFLMDLLPQGHALKSLRRFFPDIQDTPEQYWRMLTEFPIMPPGNLRIVGDGGRLNGLRNLQAYARSVGGGRQRRAAGFSREEVIQKGSDLVEHMIAHGAVVAGASGAGGAAPKFLLREDSAGLFHADGALEDAKTLRHWLVKYPRGNTPTDEEILRVEGAILDAAAHTGLRVFGNVRHEGNALFIERFDRVRPQSGAPLEYLALESFYSALGETLHGALCTHETYLGLIARHVTSRPAENEIAEYVARDILAQMTANNDNHGRNSSFLTGAAGTELAPLYDVAPMKWDSEGVSPATYWETNFASWKSDVASRLELDVGALDEALAERLEGLARMPALLEERGVMESYRRRGQGDARMQEVIDLSRRALERRAQSGL